MAVPSDKQMIAAAKRAHHDEGTLEIDPDAKVSRADDNDCKGAYVQAWIWVADTEGVKEKETGR